MLEGECFGRPDPQACPVCEEVLHLKVCESGAGFYLGFWCMEDGPISRETPYFGQANAAEVVLVAIENESNEEPGFKGTWEAHRRR